MKKYVVLILVMLMGFAHSQEYDHYNNNYQSYYYPNQNSTSNQDKKSTPAKDAVEEKNGKQAEEKKEGEKKDESDKKEEKKEEEKPKSPHTFTGNVSLVSDYRFRGISQTMRRPAIQGGFDYSHTSGVYLGTWASNVDGTTHFYNNTSMEWDFYGGYKGKFFPCSAPDFTYNFGAIYYYYPGGKTHAKENVPYNTAEFYIELSYKWLSVKYWQTLTNYFGICSDNPPFNWEKNRADRPNGSSKGSNYIEANATFDLYKKVCWPRFCLKGGKLSLLLHVGHQTVRNYEHLSYTDWRATLTQEFDWFNAFISYVGTNARHAYFDVPDNAYDPDIRHLGAQSVVIGIIRTF
ncbi:hypothetical secreted protein [Candidatus Protochlamydia naegleriophila]|uniref:Hypothetical secreted protein n=1 Tax=Candidatus Protochlamydia naegleriophila TaxID=389348 RepID=A0A0U5JGP6_9BACT|nr:TorF family putative porin [Candidatus Protochlamydia naegleriophila]CUI17988.1 hypothetical secreted protein [Candidatus Protochlamydia naegleriophila]